MTAEAPLESFLDGVRHGAVWGTMWHGAFENDEFRRAWLTEAAAQAGVGWTPAPDSPGFGTLREEMLDKLADAVDEHLDTAALRTLLELGAPKDLPFVPPLVRLSRQGLDGLGELPADLPQGADRLPAPGFPGRLGRDVRGVSNCAGRRALGEERGRRDPAQGLRRLLQLGAPRVRLVPVADVDPRGDLLVVRQVAGDRHHLRAVRAGVEAVADRHGIDGVRGGRRARGVLRRDRHQAGADPEHAEHQPGDRQAGAVPAVAADPDQGTGPEAEGERDHAEQAHDERRDREPVGPGGLDGSADGRLGMIGQRGSCVVEQQGPLRNPPTRPGEL